MYDHITDQGVAYGSCWGNIHHYGYSMRGLYVAYFLMKDVLREAGKLNEAERTLRLYARYFQYTDAGSHGKYPDYGRYS